MPWNTLSIAFFSAYLAMLGVGMFGIPISILTNFTPHSSLMIDAKRLVSRIDKLFLSYPVLFNILDSVSLGIGIRFVKYYCL